MRSLWGCQWKGMKRTKSEQFSNFEYFTTHNYSLVWGENGQEWLSVRVCSRLLPNIMRLIITPQSFLAFLSLFPPSFIHLSHSLIKGSAANKAHSHAERMCGSTNSHHNYTWFLPSSPLSSAFPSLKHPRCVFLLFPQTSLSSFIHLCCAKFVSLVWQPIRALCLLL